MDLTLSSVQSNTADTINPSFVLVFFHSSNEKTEIFREKVEIDEENKSITLVAIEGHVLESYSAYNVNYQVIPERGIVKVMIDIEKPKEEAPAPNKVPGLLCC